MDGNQLCEHGVNMKFSQDMLDTLRDKYIRKKCELGLSRAIALTCLSVLNAHTEGQIAALDAAGCMGIAGVQWVKHLGSSVNVTINCMKGLKGHVKMCLTDSECATDAVNVITEDANVAMHSGKYLFVYLEVYGSAVTYLDAAIRSVNHNGLLCVTCTDLPVLQNKCPPTTKRLYGANMWNTEYYKEMAVRVIAYNIAKSAARWNKGIKVELCAAVEHGITVVCRVLRGSKFGDKSVANLQQLMHCQLCQARQFIPDNMYAAGMSSQPICECNTDGLNAPILLLGPMWSENIFNKPFLLNLLHEAKWFNLSKCHIKLLEVMVIESECSNSTDSESDILNEMQDVVSENRIDEKDSQEGPIEKKPKLDHSEDNSITPPPADNSVNYIKILPYTATDVLSDSKNVPAFYFDFQHHSVKGGNPPTLISVIDGLREVGHRASKTHFGSRCVRTTATLKVFNDVLQKIWDCTMLNNGTKA